MPSRYQKESHEFHTALKDRAVYRPVQTPDIKIATFPYLWKGKPLFLLGGLRSSKTVKDTTLRQVRKGGEVEQQVI